MYIQFNWGIEGFNKPYVDCMDWSKTTLINSSVGWAGIDTPSYQVYLFLGPIHRDF